METETRNLSSQPVSDTLAFNAEIIAVGTELLMGDIVNTNAAYLSQELARIGVNVYFHVCVGDNPARIQETFRQALERSNLLLVTGGLGPTDDDLTVSTLAELFNTPMVKDEPSAQHIEQFFLTRDMPMSKKNIKQALRPDDGESLYNRIGTAPGLFWDVSSKVQQRGWGSGTKLIVAMPGVPREMKIIWAEEVLPRLKPFLPGHQILVSKFLKFVGIGESLLGDKLQDLMAQASPTVSPYVGEAEVKIRIAVKAQTTEAGLAKIQPVADEILARLGQYCYATEDISLEAVVGNLLRDKGYQLAVAESCTGGLVSSRLTDVPGSSDYIRFNVVAYSNAAKEQVLGVPISYITRLGAVSGPVAASMAEGACRMANANVGLSLTGIAGPDGGSEEKPVGLVYIGFAGLSDEPIVKKALVNPRYERSYIKYWFSQTALNFLRLYLLGLLHPDQE